MGIKTSEDIEEKDIKPKTSTRPGNKNNFDNFQGQSKDYTEDQLNELAKTIRKRRK